MAVQNDFRREVFYPIWIALPMTLAQFVNILYNIIDRVFIGRIPDHATEALTGLGVAFPICTLAIAFANLVGMGGAPLFSIEREKEMRRGSKVYFRQFIQPVSGHWSSVQCGDVSGKKADAIPAWCKQKYLRICSSYLSIYLCGTLFCDVKPWYECIYQCAGLANIGMMTVSIGAVCNLILDPIFILK